MYIYIYIYIYINIYYDIFKVIKPIFTEIQICLLMIYFLSSSTIKDRTQTRLNVIIWTCRHKRCICGENTLAIVLNYVILHFRDGILNILNYFGLFKQVTQVISIKQKKP